MIAEQLRASPLLAALEAGEPGALQGAKSEHGELTLKIDAARIVPVCQRLKNVHGYGRLADLTAVDWGPAEPRFEVIYHLHSISRNERLRLKCELEGARAEIDSVTGVWRSANWHEREAFDLFGIVFKNHPDLRRILMPEDWQGHPLRKDYPVQGHRYDYKDL